MGKDTKKSVRSSSVTWFANAVPLGPACWVAGVRVRWLVPVSPWVWFRSRWPWLLAFVLGAFAVGFALGFALALLC